MDGDLFGEMAFAAPASDEDSPQSEPIQGQSSTQAMMSCDLLSGSPAKANGNHPSDEPNNLLDFQHAASSSQQSLSSYADNPNQPQQTKISDASGDLFDFSKSAPAADPLSAAKPNSDEHLTTSDPFSPPTAEVDPFSSAPAAVTNNDQLIPFADHEPAPATPLDFFSVPPPVNEQLLQSSSQNPPVVDPFDTWSKSEDTATSNDSVDLFGAFTSPEAQSASVEETPVGPNLLGVSSENKKSANQPSESIQEAAPSHRSVEDGRSDDDNGNARNDEKASFDESVLNRPAIQQVGSNSLSFKSTSDKAVQPVNAAGAESLDQAVPTPTQAPQASENVVEVENLVFNDEKKIEQITDKESAKYDVIVQEDGGIPSTNGDETDKQNSLPHVKQQNPPTEVVERRVEAACDAQPSPTEAPTAIDDGVEPAKGKEPDVKIADISSAKATMFTDKNGRDSRQKDDRETSLSSTCGTGDEDESTNAILSPIVGESEPSSSTPPQTSEKTDQASSAVAEERSVASTKSMEASEENDTPAQEATNISSGDSPTLEIDEATSPHAPEDLLQLTEYSQRIESLEKELRGAQDTISQLRQQEEEGQLKDQIVDDLKKKLQMEMGKRAEAEDTSRRAKDKAEKVREQFSTHQQQSKERIGQMKSQIETLTTSEKKMQDEMVSIREERDEQTRRLNSYTTQLNEAKKNEAIKVNAADHYESKVDDLNAQLKECRDQMAQIKFERDRYKKELGNWKKYADQRTKQLESQVKHEKKLNDERKRKMRVFVEAKTEEARSTKADNLSLQAELDQTTRSLKDFNQRYKQLHSQWVQSQTRNRELQRDMAKMKNDSEKMSKVGGTLEAKLSRSASEIEDHKNRRLAAKNELMTVVAQLEAEKKASNQLKEYVRSTFTPKVLSQQQALQDNLDNFDAGLKKLAIRFGRELPAPRKKTGQPNTDTEDGTKLSGLEEIQSKITDANAIRVLSKLEEETQRVNHHIAKVSTNVDQLQNLLVAPTTKGCVGAMFNF